MSAGFRRTFDSLSVPNYRRYFTGQVVSISGNWMQIVAEMWLIVQLTGSGVSVGMTAALQFLPMLLFGAWGGLLADRLPKLKLLQYTQALMAVPALALWGADRDGRDRAVDGVRARARARLRAGDRQPRAPGVRDGARRPGADRQRGRAELRRRPHVADRRPGRSPAR